MPLTINGQTFDVPGVYGYTEVINQGGISLPAFNTLLIIGSARSGLPYNGAGLTGADVITAFTSVKDAKNLYGKSPLTDAMSTAKDAGAGVIYLLNAASLTRANAIIKDNATTPANTMKLTPKKYGATENDISVTIATVSTNVTFTIIPPKNTKYLTANALTTSKNYSVENVEGYEVGQTVLITSNATTTPQSTTITAIDATNNIITVNDLPTVAYATTDYARIFQEDTNNQDVKTFVSASTTIDDVINWINSNDTIIATRETYTGILPTTLAKTYLQNIPGATKGTSPVATETAGGDFDNVASSAPRLFEEFQNYTKSRIRIVVPVSSSAAVHAVYSTLAKTMRSMTNQASIQIVVGGALNDISLTSSDSNHPLSRVKALNNQDVILCGMDRNNIAAFISSAPYFAGMMSANSVKRNFTNDSVSASSVNKFFGNYNRDTETAVYIKAGVLVFGTGPDGYYVAEGVNTYQKHDTVWNSQDNASYLIQQVGIRDYAFESYRNQMKSGVGADGFDITAAVFLGNKILEKLVSDGYLQGGEYAPQIKDAYKEGNAIVTKPQITPIDSIDFIGFVMTLVIPD